MPLSYRNIIDVNKLSKIGTGTESIMKQLPKNSAKYINGYANDTAIDALLEGVGIVKSKEVDAYDPFHTSDSKNEEFWATNGRDVQKDKDIDTYIFKRALYSEMEDNSDYWYEDPLLPGFEISFDDFSPLFNDKELHLNSLYYFIKSYREIDNAGFDTREEIWNEFKNVFFKIFSKDVEKSENRNISTKHYYINKLSGLDNLNKKFINYGEDKITITMNEDVSMVAWYLSELYNNLIYSYRNQRFMFPENLLRFNMTIVINEMRQFQIPTSNNQNSETNTVDPKYNGKELKYNISPKSKIIYTLHDCTFNFFESKNYQNDIEMGGYGVGVNTTPQQLSFDIYFKSVTRYSEFPLISNTPSINAWETDKFFITNNSNPLKGTKQRYLSDLNNISTKKETGKKGYLNQLLTKGKQSITNIGTNYLDNLETKLRENRGSAVNNLLSQFSQSTGINKIEPDNVYESNFNNRISVKNLGNTLASEIITDLTDTIRDTSNF